MSGAKGGSVAIVPAILFGAAGMAALAVIGGVALGVTTAANVVRAAWDRKERERQQATSEQNAEVEKVLQEWQNRLTAHGESSGSETTRSARSKEEILAEMVTGHYESLDLKDGALLQSLREVSPQPSAASAIEVTAASPEYDLSELIGNIREMLLKVKIKLPNDIMNQVSMLERVTEIDRAAELAFGIRLGIGRELDRIAEEQRQEMRTAREMLEGLPPTFPSEARSILTEAAEGRTRFDQETQKYVKEMIQAACNQRAAQVMQKTFTDMGYDIEPIGDSLLTEGGDVYFRRVEWADGYCVKIVMKDGQIKFLMQKTTETGCEYDEDMEREWKTRFSEVQGTLRATGIQLDVQEVNPEKKKTIPNVSNIRIKTRKKKITVESAASTDVADSGSTQTSRAREEI